MAKNATKKPAVEQPAKRPPKKPKVANVNKLLDTSRERSDTESNRLRCAEFALDVYLLHNSVCPQLPLDSKGLTDELKKMAYRKDDDHPDLTAYNQLVHRVVHKCNLEGVAINLKLAEEAAQAAVILRQLERSDLLASYDGVAWPMFQPKGKDGKPRGNPVKWLYRDFNHSPKSMADRLVDSTKDNVQLVVLKQAIDRAILKGPSTNKYGDFYVVTSREVFVASHDFLVLMRKSWENSLAKGTKPR